MVIQGGFRAVIQILILVALVIVGGRLLWWLITQPKLIVLCVCALIFYLLLAVGTSHPIMDGAAVATSGLVTVTLLSFEKRRPHKAGAVFQRWAALKGVLLLVLLSWVGILGVDYITHPAPLGSHDLRHLTKPQKGDRAGPARIAIALSGGGYRAALLHAGVISELDRMHIPIQAVSSVSGGSILSSFWIAGGAPEEFLSAVIEGRFNLKRQLLSLPNLSRLILSARVPGTSFQFLPIGDFSRTDVQANLLDAVYLNGLKHRDTGLEEGPELMVCTTNIAAAEMLGITPYGIVTQRITLAAARTRFANPAAAGIGETLPPNFTPNRSGGLPDNERLATLVSASGAFPGAFNPVRRILKWEDEPGGTGDYIFLADGGLGDNLGLTLAVAANHLAQVAKLVLSGRKGYGGIDLSIPDWRLSRWDVDLILVSDGSALGPGNIPTSGLAEIGSAIDTMYAATGGVNMVGKIDAEIAAPPAVLLTPRMLVGSVERDAINSDELAHLFFGTELVLAPTPKGEPPRVFSFTSIAPETLSFIISNMAQPDQGRASQLVQDCIATGAYRDGRWIRFDASDGTSDRKLFALVVKEFSIRLRAFIRTSTLDDQVGEADARSIFLLGRYLARLNAPYIVYEMKRAELSRKP